jgi:CheY-like chemotaxis protein
MDPHEISSELYLSFSSACKERQERIQQVFDWFDAKEIGVDEAFDRLSLELHDHIGDAKMLRLERVSETTIELDNVVDSWRKQHRNRSNSSTADRQRELEKVLEMSPARAWMLQLMNTSRRFVEGVGDSGQVGDLQALRLEIARALGPTGETQGDGDDTNPGKDMVHKRVLLLDDSEIARELLSETLEEMGHIVITAADASQFWQRIDDSNPNVIFLDINIPDSSGDLICKQLRKREAFKKVPIVIYSSLSDEELEPLTAATGATGYISKQRGMDSLRDYVEDLVDQGVL